MHLVDILYSAEGGGGRACQCVGGHGVGCILHEGLQSGQGGGHLGTLPTLRHLRQLSQPRAPCDANLQAGSSDGRHTNGQTLHQGRQPPQRAVQCPSCRERFGQGHARLALPEKKSPQSGCEAGDGGVYGQDNAEGPRGIGTANATVHLCMWAAWGRQLNSGDAGVVGHEPRQRIFQQSPV